MVDRTVEVEGGESKAVIMAAVLAVDEQVVAGNLTVGDQARIMNRIGEIANDLLDEKDYLGTVTTRAADFIAEIAKV